MDEKQLSQVAAYTVKVLQQMQTFKDWLIGLVCQAIFGVERPEQIPGAIVSMVDETVKRHGVGPATMTDEEFLERFKTALANPEVMKILGPIVLDLRRAEVREADAGRSSAIREQIGVRYSADDIPEALVRLIKGKLVLRGHPDGWPSKIADFLDKLEEQAVTTIQNLLLKKHEAEDVSGYGRFVVLSGVDPEDPRAVHELLADREGIGTMLRKKV